MRDGNRLKERIELHLERRQITSLSVVALLLLAGVFAVGVLVGKNLAPQLVPPPTPEALLDRLDAEVDAGSNELTFQEELTRKLPNPPPPPPRAAAAPSRGSHDGAGFAGSPPPTPSRGSHDGAGFAGSPPLTPSRGSHDGAGFAGSPPLTPSLGSRDGAGFAGSPPLKPAPKPPPKSDDGAKDTHPPLPQHPALATAEAGTAGGLSEKPSNDSGIEVAVTSSAGPSERAFFTVQVKATQSEIEANQFAQKLRGQGYQSHIAEAELPGKGRWYRVRVGRFDNRTQADRYLEDFQRETHLQAFVTAAGH